MGGWWGRLASGQAGEREVGTARGEVERWLAKGWGVYLCHAWP